MTNFPALILKCAVHWLESFLVLAVLMVVVSLCLFFADARFYYIKTGSMANLLPSGSLVLTLPSENYLVGDIVAYKRKDNKVSVHRIVEIENKPDSLDTEFITKGDANPSNDPDRISSASVIGKVALFARPSEAGLPRDILLFVLVVLGMICGEFLLCLVYAQVSARKHF